MHLCNYLDVVVTVENVLRGYEYARCAKEFGIQHRR